MNVVERTPPRTAQTAAPEPQGAAGKSEIATGKPEAAAGAPEAAPAREAKLRPLASLIPYVRRYGGRAAAALCALVVAALATLAVPLAVRRMIDFGFTGQGLGLIDSYFSVMIAVAAVLALASAATMSAHSAAAARPR